MKTSKNPYKYATAIMIIIFGSMILSPVSFMPEFPYAGGRLPAIMLHGDDYFSLGVFIFKSIWLEIPLSMHEKGFCPLMSS